MQLTSVVLIVCLILFAFTDLTKAQDNRTEFDSWIDIATIYSIGGSFRYDGDYGIRHLLSSREFTQIYLRPSVRYRFSRDLMVHGGFAWFQSFFTNNPNLTELRPWVGIRLLWPRFSGFVVSNYLRFEYRISSLQGEDEWNRQLRGRFQIQITSPDFSIGNTEKFYALFFVEPFQDIDTFGEQIFADRIRYNFGFGNRITNLFRMELNFLLQNGRINDEGGGFNIDDYILRLRMFWVMN